MERCYAFRAHNSETVFGWGYFDEAVRFVQLLNAINGTEPYDYCGLVDSEDKTLNETGATFIIGKQLARARETIKRAQA
jgi:hypothetical protein